MRTSLNEIKIIEEYRTKLLSPRDRLLFEAQLLVDEKLKENLLLQKRVEEVVQAYGRKKLREELENVSQRLFERQSFRDKVTGYFKR